MWEHNWNVGWGWMTLGSIMMVMMVLFWGAVIWLLAELARDAGIRARGRHGEESAREIAHRRLAGGELTPEQHRAIVERIRG